MDDFPVDTAIINIHPFTPQKSYISYKSKDCTDCVPYAVNLRSLPVRTHFPADLVFYPDLEAAKDQNCTFVNFRFQGNVSYTFNTDDCSVSQEREPDNYLWPIYLALIILGSFFMP